MLCGSGSHSADGTWLDANLAAEAIDCITLTGAIKQLDNEALKLYIAVVSLCGWTFRATAVKRGRLFVLDLGSLARIWEELNKDGSYE